MNLQPLPPMPPEYAGMIAQQSQQQAFQTTLQQVDPQSYDGAVPAAIEPLPADTLYRYFCAWESAKQAEIHEQFNARRYYNGKQWTDREIRELRRRGQPVVTANLIKFKVDFLVGVEQRLRRDVKAYPRIPDHEDAAWIATAGLRFVEDLTKWPRHASDAMNDALVTGIGVIFQGIEAKYGKAEICKRHVPSDRFFYDPRSERWDFSDARFLGVHQWMDIDEALELLPQAADMINAMAGAGIAGGPAAGSTPSLFSKEKNWIDTERKRIYIVEIHYKNQGHWLYDYLCGPVSLLPAEQTDRMNPYMDEEGCTCHPYMAWSPYVDERGDRYGVVRDMFSLQDEVNKRRSKMLHMLNVRQTMGEEGAVADVDAMKRELARPDGHVVVALGQGDKFQILDQSAQVQGQFELLQEAKNELMSRGPNPALVGQDVQGQSGRAILAQQNSGMTELSPVFERGREWKLSVFRRDWCLVRQYWTGERWIRVTGNDDAPEFLGINQIVQGPMGQIAIRNDVTQIDVDIILEEGPDTITMQEELMNQLSNLGPQAVPPEVFIQLSNVKDKDKILKMISDAKAPPPELVAMQKRMGDLEAMLKAAQIDKTQADSENARAQALGNLAKNGLTPEFMTDLPFIYREPTELQRMGAALDQGAMPQPPQGGPPPGPPGQVANPQALGGPPPPPNPMNPGEPRLNQAGGLPVPGTPPGVPLQ